MEYTQTNGSATIIDHKDFNKDALFICSECKWKGSYGEAWSDLYEKLHDVQCPKCTSMILVVGF